MLNVMIVVEIIMQMIVQRENSLLRMTKKQTRKQKPL